LCLAAFLLVPLVWFFGFGSGFPGFGSGFLVAGLVGFRLDNKF
jgi:hypothetical protein